MKCQEVRELWEEYIRGKLSKSQEQAVAGHLQQCINCRQEYNNLSETYKKLQSIPQKNVPGELWQSIESTLEQKEKKILKEKVWIFPRQTRLALSFATIVLLISFMGMQINVYQNRRIVNNYLGELVDYLQAESSWVEYSDITVGTLLNGNLSN
ncbi:MAG: zf-HC2 domain-containing protein [Candidatus Margulisbacteria bacterium]|nr:zf-HC2 domain-containing protein [Candidatus Margulisiibacteriota bacterium]